MPNVIEEAKSGRASCRTCRKAIAKGELRFGEEAPSGFGDTPQMRWHHLSCAAERLPAELKEVLDKHPGEVPDRAKLDEIMQGAMAAGHAKPGGFPYADKAPTGRARCLQCQQNVAKDELRVAIEREIDTGAMVTRGAGYLHPACAAQYLEAHGEDKDKFVAQLRANSRLQPNDLDAVVAQL